MSIELTRRGNVAVLTLAHPPVNAFNLPTRRAIVDAFDELRDDSHIAAIVVTGAGSGFSAGGDRKEFGSPQASERPTLSRDVLAAISSCGKPVIAAIHGFAVGGGLEFALACHARIAVAAARIGLPEVTLGRFPLSGSQRLPRLLGLERAVEWMFEAHMTISADTEARNIFELIVDDQESLLPAAIELAERSIRILPVLVEHMAFVEQDPASAIARIEAKYPLPQRTKAQHALLLAVSAAVSAADFHAGLEQAQQIFDQLVATS